MTFEDVYQTNADTKSENCTRVACVIANGISR